MNRLRAIIWAMGIWTTAASTLLAGLPHLDCRCPDGRVKPFCLSLLIPSNCCDRSCCADPAGSQEKTKPCCCCQASLQAENPSEQIRPQGCQKTLAAAQLADRSDHVRSWASAIDFSHFDGCGSESFENCNPQCGWFVASPDCSPPSSDLVIALRHLLI